MYDPPDPALNGILELSSAYIKPQAIAANPDIMKLTATEGPAYYAAMPVKAKMPPPIVFPIPNIVSSTMPNATLLFLREGLGVSGISFKRNSLPVKLCSIESFSISN